MTNNYGYQPPFTSEMFEAQQRSSMASAAEQTARDTARSSESLESLTAAMQASLQISQDMRDHAKQATDAAKDSGRHSLIVAYIFGGGSLAVAVASLVISLST